MRGLKIPASSFSPAREGGIQGLSFFLSFLIGVGVGRGDVATLPTSGPILIVASVALRFSAFSAGLQVRLVYRVTSASYKARASCSLCICDHGFSITHSTGYCASP